MMRTFYALAFCILFQLGATAQAPITIEWDVSSLSSLASNRPIDIIRANDGSYLVAGTAAAGKMWIAKFTMDGTQLWSKIYGGPNISDEATAILEMANGELMVVGHGHGEGGDITGSNGQMDIWLLRLDADGNMIWQKCYGGSLGDMANDMIPVPGGGVVVAGQTRSTDGDVPTSQGEWDMWLLKLDDDGEVIWSRTYGGSGADIAASVQQTNDGGFIVGGTTTSSDGDVSFNHGESDIWILKLNAIGEIEWQRTYGGSANEFYMAGVVEVADGYVFATSTNSSDGDLAINYGDYDMWVVKLNQSGQPMWQHSYGGSGSELVFALTPTLEGGFIITGNASTMDGHVTHYHGGPWDAWVVNVDHEGSLIWQRCFGGSTTDQGFDLLQDPDGTYVLAAWSNSNDGDVTSDLTSPRTWLVKFSLAYNIMSGKVFLDLDSSGEHDDGDILLQNHIIHASGTPVLTSTYTNGEYFYATGAGAGVSLQPAPMLYYNAVPATHSHTFGGEGEIVQERDFAFQPQGVVTDLMATVIPLTAFRPGFHAAYEVSIKNIGTVPGSGNIHFFLPDNGLLTYAYASVEPMTIQPLSWVVEDLAVMDEMKVIVAVLVDQTAVLDSQITSQAEVQAPGDADPLNDLASATIIVTGSYDPNDIQVDKEVLLVDDLPQQPKLEYLIRFQNTGTDTAFTVQIRNPVPVGVDLSTFEFLGASHPVQLQYATMEDVLWFRFYNILLPDSNTNEILSHGYVRYKISPRTDLLLGDVIENQVGIYFDFNEPVITNTAITEIVTPTAMAEQVQAGQLLLHPNPTSGDLLIQMDLHHAARVHVEMFNGIGQIMRTTPVRDVPAGQSHFALSCEGLPDGVYHVRIHMGGEVVTRKVVKL